MNAYAASFDAQFSSLAPFVLYVLIGAIVFVETGLLFGFFLPGDSILFSAGLVAAAHGNINIALLVTIIVLAAFFGDQIGFVIGQRINATNLEYYTPSGLLINYSATSVGLNNVNMWDLRFISVYSTDSPISIGFLGASFTSTQVSDFRTAVTTYITSL